MVSRRLVAGECFAMINPTNPSLAGTSLAYFPVGGPCPQTAEGPLGMSMWGGMEAGEGMLYRGARGGGAREPRRRCSCAIERRRLTEGMLYRGARGGGAREPRRRCSCATEIRRLTAHGLADGARGTVACRGVRSSPCFESSRPGPQSRWWTATSPSTAGPSSPRCYGRCRLCRPTTPTAAAARAPPPCAPWCAVEWATRSSRRRRARSLTRSR